MLCEFFILNIIRIIFLVLLATRPLIAEEPPDLFHVLIKLIFEVLDLLDL